MTLLSREFSGTPAEKERWFIALNRFGLGAKLGQINSVDGKPEDWLINQIDYPSFNFPSAFPSSTDFITRNTQLVNTSRVKSRDQIRRSFFSDYNNYVLDRLKQEVFTPSGFDLRVLNFFSNHFSVSKGGRLDTALAPTLEKEAIAPNLFGRFEELLLAVVKHPAMIRYLDNQLSFGPNSKLGLRENKGFNENLAREVLELHTLGVDGGYTQKDVEALAHGITGWSIRYKSDTNEAGFHYKYAGHEPGAFYLLGKPFSPDNIKQGEAMLRFVAQHKNTALHICRKIAVHFIGPNVSNSLIEKLTNVWIDSAGNLKRIFEALINSEESWYIDNYQYKQPREYVISVLRALPATAKVKYTDLHKALVSLGQGPFMAGSPAGFEQEESYWNTPMATLAKIDWVNNLVQNNSDQVDEVLFSQFLDGMNKNQKRIVLGAETKQKALLLFFVSPFFLRK